MALIRSRTAPDSASAKRCSTMSVAGCFSLIHSKIGQESRTRVFKFALLFSELQEILLYTPTSAPELSPGIAFGKHNLMPADFERELGAFFEIERFPNLLRDGNLPFGGNCNPIHRLILPRVSRVGPGN